MKKLFCLIISGVFVLTLCACGGKPSASSGASTVSQNGSAASTQSATSAVTLSEITGDSIKTIGVNLNLSEFDESFLEFVAKKKDGNYMASPLSFRYALGLLLAGAEGETKAQLLTALGVKSVDEWTAYCTKFNGFVKQFYSQLDAETKQFNAFNKGNSSASGAPDRALRVANSVWKRADIDKDYKSSYKSYISSNYGAEYNVFTPRDAVQKINAWVNDKTEKLIPRLLQDNYDTTNLAVVLMNALYYKNNWEKPFNSAATKKDDFTTKSGTKVQKQFMEQTETFKYYSDGKTQLVILPMYSGVNMAFVLGDTTSVKTKIAKAEDAKVHVKIPKMDVDTSFENGEFIEFLAQRGVADAFDPQKADFSAMIEHQIWVDDIIQKTKIKTDEEGVEAAAVTAILTKDGAFMPTGDKPVDFIADKPFSFYIYATCDDVTSTLFAGQISE